MAASAGAIARTGGKNPTESVLGLSMALAWMSVHCKKETETDPEKLTKAMMPIVKHFVKFFMMDEDALPLMTKVVQEIRMEAMSDILDGKA